MTREAIRIAAGQPIERRWTVVAGRPDYLCGDAAHPSEEAMIAVVEAATPHEAAGKARAVLAYECADQEDEEDIARLADDFAVLRVFEGDLSDRYIDCQGIPDNIEEQAMSQELMRLAAEQKERNNAAS